MHPGVDVMTHANHAGVGPSSLGIIARVTVLEIHLWRVHLITQKLMRLNPLTASSSDSPGEPEGAGEVEVEGQFCWV